MGVTRVNHAVLYVRDAGSSAEFYQRTLGLEVAHRPSPQAVFLRAASSTNDHDLGLFGVGDAVATNAGRGGVGMYHLAWEVDTLAELVAVRERLLGAGALVGESDHGASKSLYAHDPDGLEFEVMWQVPVDLMTDDEGPVTKRLELDKELARFGTQTIGRRH